MAQLQLVAQGIDSLWLNIKAPEKDGLPIYLADELDELRRQAQDVEDDLPTRFTFAGETLFLKPHGIQRQWRWILHSPSLHLDVGRGLRNHVMGKARLSSAFLWERGIADALSLHYDFLVGFYGGEGFTLQDSEVHLCADIAGWELSLDDLPRFISRAHVKRKAHVLQATDMTEEDTPDQMPEVEVNYDGRHVTGFEFSKGGAHSAAR
jgi:hypothetical protein